MTRLYRFALTALLVAPLAARAQEAPPLPPLPSVPPVPVAPALPPDPPVPVEPSVPPQPPAPVPVLPEIGMPVPVPAPRPLAVPMPSLGDAWELRSQDWQAWADQWRAEAEQFRLPAEQQRQMMEQARLVSRQARRAVDDLRSGMFDVDVDLQRPLIARARGDNERGVYNSGLNALQRREYDRAIQLFDQVIGQKGDHADAATYWKAFSQARLVRTDEALATIAALRRDYPKSRYLGEAQVLEADVRRLAGQRVDPQTLDANDELKLIAINGIARTDPDRAIPLLEGVLSGANTLANKRRALFVLALIKDPRAHAILLRYAKGAGSPELQIEAIRNLVSRRDDQTTDAELREIYQAAEDPVVRRTIIDAYGAGRDKAALLDIVKNKDEAADMKRAAIGRLNGLAAPAELWPLYQTETDVELRAQMINVFAAMDAVEQLTAIAKTESDPRLRMRALRSLGSQPANTTGPLLVDLYAANGEPDARRAIVNALRNQQNADALVAIARKETTLDLKRDIVRALSEMAPTNKAAADFLMEMIQ